MSEITEWETIYRAVVTLEWESDARVLMSETGERIHNCETLQEAQIIAGLLNTAYNMGKFKVLVQKTKEDAAAA